jgi:hypothetical protein
MSENGGVLATPETQKQPLTLRLREEAAFWDDGEELPLLLIKAASAIEYLAAAFATDHEALRWIALGRTGSYGTLEAFAAAVHGGSA